MGNLYRCTALLSLLAAAGPAYAVEPAGVLSGSPLAGAASAGHAPLPQGPPEGRTAGQAGDASESRELQAASGRQMPDSLYDAEEDRDRWRDRLLDESIERLLPLEPAEIERYIRKRDTVEDAIEPSPARMRTQTRRLPAVPGAAPQVIRLTAGYSSTIMFQDSTGSPWPVLSVVIGNPRAFQAGQPDTGRQPAGSDASGRGRGDRQESQGGGDDTQSSLVTVVPLTNHASSNLVVSLEGAPYPVILHLLTESSARKGRVDDALVVFRLDRAGPKAAIPSVGPSVPGPVTPELLSFVHGIPPQGARRIHLEPALPGTSLWDFAGDFYLRTIHRAVWPAWSAQAGQEEKVYVMPKTPSVVLSVDGKRVTLRAGGSRK